MEVQSVEEMLKRRLAIGSSVPVGKIVEQLVVQGRRLHVVRMAVDALSAPYVDAEVDLVVGVEARGFLFAAPIAYRMGAGCIPFRKPGKLPYETVEHTYDLEYGTDTLAAHVDAIGEGSRVLLVDDVLATGGTAAAASRLVADLGGSIVGCAFLLELGFLAGRERLQGQSVTSVLAL